VAGEGILRNRSSMISLVQRREVPPCEDTIVKHLLPVAAR
jgi:hypothetical protein